MESFATFWQLALLLLVARVLAELFSRGGHPGVLGELLAGLLLGPSLLGWVVLSDTLRFLGEVGVVLLLFRIGHHTDTRRLRAAGSESLRLALAGMLIPLSLGTLTAYHLFDLGLAGALMVGCALSATSISITLRILDDLGHTDSRFGNIILSAAVLDDMLAVVLLSLLYDFALTQALDPWHGLRVVLSIGLFFLLAPFTARAVALIIRRLDTTAHIPGLVSTATFCTVLLFAALAQAVGAPALLGGFAAGLALSHHFLLPIEVETPETEAYTDRIAESMHPLNQFFTPIFFASVGLSLNLSALQWQSPAWLGLTLTLIAIALVGKLLGGLAVPGPLRHRFAVGLAMLPRGEVFIVFVELGHRSRLIAPDTQAALLLALACIMLIAPFAIEQGFRHLNGEME